MDKATLQRLNAINRDFYQRIADEFDQTRRESWSGWERLLPYLSGVTSVLDVGCGNGRFGLFLREHLALPEGQSLRYHGLDSNPTLLDYARQSLRGLDVHLEERDIIEAPPDSGQYDLVVLFGVMHHVPGADQRKALVRALAERVVPGGLLAFACWRFYQVERLRARVIPWPDDINIEPGDYLLDWRRGQHALRYCHYVDDTEHRALIQSTGLAELITYRADGDDNCANQYSLLRK
jgi:2-polyprenyl-3-methyl-5-hydroxy-6-metoxy-1,4-benzoquinol methylase